jgi:hypothetical protein
MNRRNMLSLSTAALLCLGAFSNAQADETLKFRTIMHAASAQSQEVGDVEGHTAGLHAFPDSLRLPTGRSALAISLPNRLHKRRWHAYSYSL